MLDSDHGALFRREVQYRVGEASVEEFMLAIEKNSKDDDLCDIMQAIKIRFLKATTNP